MNGYHVYYQIKETDQHPIDYFAQLASILFWKKYFGEIRLFCNSEYLEKIKEYQLDTLYDEINVSVLDNIVHADRIEKYKVFPKIYVAQYLSNTQTGFCILDTDLWFLENVSWDLSCDFVGLNYEEFKINFKNNPYIRHTSFINVDLNWKANPINCSFMYINNRNLVDKWYSYCLSVIDSNKEVKKQIDNVYSLFIGNRLISSIASDNYKTTTLIPNVYRTYHSKKINPWEPELSLDPSDITSKIKHIWGLKNSYDDTNVSIKITNNIFNDIHNEFGILEPYLTKIYIERLKILQNESSIY